MCLKICRRREHISKEKYSNIVSRKRKFAGEKEARKQQKVLIAIRVAGEGQLTERRHMTPPLVAHGWMARTNHSMPQNSVPHQ
jgi:hypothetical protein